MADLRVDDLASHVSFPAEKRKGGGGPWVLVVLLLCLLGGGGYFGWQDRTRLEGEVASAEKAATAAKAAAGEAEKARDKAAEELKAQEKRVAELESAVAKKTNEGEVNDRLIADLRSKLDIKDGEVSGDANRIAVNLVDQILFKSGEAELSPRGAEVLGKVGAVLKTLTDKQILIGGHTDDRPIHSDRFPSNWELSAARAVNVVHYLVDKVGVDPHKVAAAAYSEFHPRAKHSKAKNRRIEILLTPMVEVR